MYYLDSPYTWFPCKRAKDMKSGVELRSLHPICQVTRANNKIRTEGARSSETYTDHVSEFPLHRRVILRNWKVTKLSLISQRRRKSVEELCNGGNDALTAFPHWSSPSYSARGPRPTDPGTLEKPKLALTSASSSPSMSVSGGRWEPASREASASESADTDSPGMETLTPLLPGVSGDRDKQAQRIIRHVDMQTHRCQTWISQVTVCSVFAIHFNISLGWIWYLTAQLLAFLMFQEMENVFPINCR